MYICINQISFVECWGFKNGTPVDRADHSVILGLAHPRRVLETTRGQPQQASFWPDHEFGSAEPDSEEGQ